MEIEPSSIIVEEGLKEEIKRYVARIRQEASRREWCAKFIDDNLDKFIALGVKPGGFANFLDLDNLTREQVVEALKLFPGKYSKSVSQDRMDYERDLGNGVILRFFNAALPPGCKLVEKTIGIPAQQATTRTVFEIQCGENNESQIV